MRPHLAARAASLLALAALGACWRRPGPDRGASPNPTERPVADATAAYACAVGAVQQMGYAVPQEAVDRAQGAANVGGGAFRAERVTPYSAYEEIVDYLTVSVRVRDVKDRPDELGAVLRASVERWRETVSRGDQAGRPALTPRAQPGGVRPGPAEAVTSRRRAGQRRQRLPLDVTPADAAALVQRCAGG